MPTNLLDELHAPAFEVAQRLLGSYLIRDVDGQKLIGKIVETEAYDQADAASHSYRGKTARTAIMFGPPGFAYVYFTYGMHYCMNVVTGKNGVGSAVLLRAVEPISGVSLMKKLREKNEKMQLTNGPAKLCQAFQITKAFNGHNLETPPLTLKLNEPIARKDTIETTRIGITKDTNRQWRFYVRDNPFVSKV